MVKCCEEKQNKKWSVITWWGCDEEGGQGGLIRSQDSTKDFRELEKESETSGVIVSSNALRLKHPGQG